MNFFLDHDVPEDLGRLLRRKGHSVEILKEVLPIRTEDLAALRYAVERNQIVITCNRRDFLRLAQTEKHVGMIILIRRQTRIAECAAAIRFIARAGESGIANNINFA